jgi:hypothetical protein
MSARLGGVLSCAVSIALTACGGSTATGGTQNDAGAVAAEEAGADAHPADSGGDATAPVADGASGSPESGSTMDTGAPTNDGAVSSCPNGCPACGPDYYCQWLSDGMGNGGGGCMTIPPQCQPNPTCVCLLAPDAGNGGCTCTGSSGSLVVTCC